MIRDPLDSRLWLTHAERTRLYPTPAPITDQMVQNHFEVRKTEAVFRAIFSEFVKREVA